MVGAELKLPWRKVDGRIRALASIEEALRVLRTRRGIISGMLGRMREREQSLRTRISSDVSGGRQERLALRVSEYKDVQRIIGILEAAELSLEKAILRLENVQYYLLITGELAAAVQALRGVGEILDSIPGNLRSVTDELADTLAWITGNASLSEDLAIDGTSGIVGNFDVQDIIDEAVDEVSDLIMKKFETPEPRAVDMDEVSRILGAAKDVGNNRFNETIAGVVVGRRSAEDEQEGVAV
jgi:NTP pyrophosphatase (non-canonical NTP hydrolase)